MLINEIDISNFKSKLMTRNIVNAQFVIVNEWLANSLTPIIDDKIKHKYKTLTFTLDVICGNANELETMKSNLTKQLAISTIKFDDIDYYYKGFVIGDIVPHYIMEGNETLDITMLVIAEKAEVVETMNHVASKTINIAGNSPSPAIVTITAQVDTISVTLAGLGDTITINNLKANIPVIIDGEACTVMSNGANKFGDTDMWEFPTLQPGVNSIGISTANCVINISYKPKFI